MKYNNNLTDIIENLEEKDNEQANSTNKPWEVKNNDDEVIKLDDRLKNNQIDKL